MCHTFSIFKKKKTLSPGTLLGFEKKNKKNTMHVNMTRQSNIKLTLKRVSRVRLKTF
jgi:hypothetical protein